METNCSFEGCTVNAYGHGWGTMCLHHFWVESLAYVDSIRAALNSGDTRAFLDSVSVYGPNSHYLNHSARSGLWSCAMTMHFKDASNWTIGEAIRLAPSRLDSLARDIARWADDMGISGPKEYYPAW